MNPPEYYLKKVNDIKNDLVNLPNDPSTVKYNTQINADYNKLSEINTELINIIDTIETPENSNISVKLYEDYKDLYLTYYFTNISILLGICLLIRYIIYYINI